VLACICVCSLTTAGASCKLPKSVCYSGRVHNTFLLADCWWEWSRVTPRDMRCLHCGRQVQRTGCGCQADMGVVVGYVGVLRASRERFPEPPEGMVAAAGPRGEIVLRYGEMGMPHQVCFASGTGTCVLQHQRWPVVLKGQAESELSDASRLAFKANNVCHV
jgi:hypothetical protein